jgi:hypothetical protein
MKTSINKQQKNKAICRVFDNYPQAFENKVKAIAMKEEFNQECDDISELISKLLRPASTIHRPKQDSQQKLATSLNENIGMGILLATHLENMPLLDILKVYRSKVANVSAYKLYEMAVHVAEELQKNAELAVEFGLTEEKLTAFTSQIADFGETLDNTDARLTDRKAGWKDLNKKLLFCSKLIRQKLDPFVEFNEKDLPEMFKDYFLVRGSRKRRKRTTVDSTLCDISGIVTDSVTNLPVANATINIVEQESAYTTDEDGYYLVDEAPAGAYTITCYAIGYDVPQQVNCTLVAGESVVVDFSITPVTPPTT